MSKLFHREVSDLLMLAYALGAQKAMPSISDARAVEKFNAEFGHLCSECDVEALRNRLKRMKAEHLEGMKS